MSNHSNGKLKLVSIIIPCRNEKDHIKNFLWNLIKQDYNNKNLEIIIIDGNSQDGTKDIIQQFIKKYKNMKLLINPDKIVPISLNIGIKKARGEIIIRMDVHALYPKDYISKLVYWIKKLEADNVGGQCETVSFTQSLKSKAIAAASASFIAVGNAWFRTGTRQLREVDTVPFGCYKKDVFKKIGLFDEELVRNQDDEFNFRLKKAGGKIYLIPDIVITYFARSNFIKLFKQYFQYGYWKTKILKKHKSLAAFRHVVPASFILFLLSFPLVYIIKNYIYFFLFCIGFYLLLLLFYSLKEIIKKKINPLALFLSMTSIFIMHISYGTGFLKGIIDFIILSRNK